MKKTVIKKIVFGSFATLFMLIAVLAVHIYIVTHPKPMDERAVAMARIDIHQNISQADADKISAWLYKQKGVDHVLCNPQSAIVVFTFHPVVVSANLITSDFKSSFDYPQAIRIVPSAAQLKSGCPAMGGGSSNYSLISYLKHII